MKCLEPTDKVKTCYDIFVDAQMDVRGYFKSPIKQERVLLEILRWYEITEKQLYQLKYLKVKRLYMFLLHEISFLDYEKIAKLTNCRYELQVVQGIEKIRAVMRKDKDLLLTVGGIIDRLKAYSELYPE